MVASEYIPLDRCKTEFKSLKDSNLNMYTCHFEYYDAVRTGLICAVYERHLISLLYKLNIFFLKIS